MNEASRTEFETAVAELVGKPCWAIAAGAGTGSVIGVAIGDAVPRREALHNPLLTPRLRTHEGQYSLYVECAWRIDSPSQVWVGCWDDNGPDGAMLKGLEAITNQVIRRVELVSPALDLYIHFENDLVLRVFCDQTNDEDANDNYSLFVPGDVFVVSSRSVLRKEARQSP